MAENSQKQELENLVSSFVIFKHLVHTYTLQEPIVCNACMFAVQHSPLLISCVPTERARSSSLEISVRLTDGRDK